MTYLMYDLAIALILLFSLWRGYRKGFVLTLCGFLALFVAFIGASVLSDMLAEPMARSIQPIVEQHITQVMEEYSSTQLSDVLDEAAQELPLDEFLTCLKKSPIYRSFAQSIEAAADAGLVAASTNAARLVADYVAKQVARILLFTVAFVLILIVWSFLSHALDLAFRLPVLSTLNHWSGALLGLLEGFALLIIACWLLKDSFIPPDAVANTYLLGLLCNPSLFLMVP